MIYIYYICVTETHVQIVAAKQLRRPIICLMYTVTVVELMSVYVQAIDIK